MRLPGHVCDRRDGGSFCKRSRGQIADVRLVELPVRVCLDELGQGSVSSADILDPYAVEDGWFEILLPSLQLVVTDAVPERLRVRAEFVLDRLRLRDDARVLRQRAEWYRMYVERQMTLSELARKAPLIARAVRASRQPP